MNTGLAFILVLLVAFLIYFVWRMVTGRSSRTSTKDWLLYFLLAPLMIAAFMGAYFYAASRGFSEEIIVKQTNISITALFVFGYAVRVFWHHRKRWTLWAELSVLTLAHFVLLQRLHWDKPSYFFLMIVVGIPESLLVVFLLGLMFRSKVRPLS